VGMIFFRTFLWIGIAFAALTAFAKPREDNPVTLIALPTDTLVAAAGDTVLARIPLTVTAGYHVNANPAAREDYIPLEVKLDSTDVALAFAPRYPNGRTHRLEDTTEDLLVYDGTVVVELPLVIRPDAAAGPHALRGTVEFQACDDRVCFFPEERPLRVVLLVR
ncbi:MAG: protein-disulfide reductase DsbD family protein, partial [bacterium]|nr:protein-disulfide reductase DsbD family protein [bacterium]